MKYTLTLAAIFAVVGLLCSCSEKYPDPQKLADEAIAKCEKVDLGAPSPQIGDLTLLRERISEVADTLVAMTKEAIEKTDVEKLQPEERDSIGRIWRDAIMIASQHYADIFEKEAQKYVGLKLPTAHNTAVFSASEMNIRQFRDFKEVMVEYKLTASSKRGKFFRMIVIDENQQPLTSYTLLCAPCAAGTTFTGTTAVPIELFKHKLMFLFGE